MQCSGLQADLTAIYCCPICKGNLSSLPDLYLCEQCEKVFPVRWGIPDFRVFRDSNYNPADEMLKAEQLVQDRGQLDYGQLRGLYIELTQPRRETWSPRLEDLIRDQNRRALSIEGRVRDIRFSIAHLLSIVPTQAAYGCQLALDNGCGHGMGILSLASSFSQVIGVDISFLGLLLAQKLLSERGVTNYALICACAEALPFRENLFNFVSALALIEHVSDQESMIRETHRVLKQGGAFMLTSPNRYFVREPHKNIVGVGFVPRRFQEKYVHWMSRNQLGYSGYRLLSYIELRSMMREVYGRSWTCRVHLVNRSIPPRTLLGKLYRKLGIIPMITESFPYKLFCATHTVIAWKDQTGEVKAELAKDIK